MVASHSIRGALGTAPESSPETFGCSCGASTLAVRRATIEACSILPKPSRRSGTRPKRSNAGTLMGRVGSGPRGASGHIPESNPRGLRGFGLSPSTARSTIPTPDRRPCVAEQSGKGIADIVTGAGGGCAEPETAGSRRAEGREKLQVVGARIVEHPAATLLSLNSRIGLLRRRGRVSVLRQLVAVIGPLMIGGSILLLLAAG